MAVSLPPFVRTTRGTRCQGPLTPPIHTNTDLCFFQPLSERLGRELDALIGIEDLRRALRQGFFPDR